MENEVTQPKKNENSVLKKFSSFNEGGVLIALILLCLVIGFMNPVFFTGNNIIKVLRQFSSIGIIAVGGSTCHCYWRN